MFSARLRTVNSCELAAVTVAIPWRKWEGSKKRTLNEIGLFSLPVSLSLALFVSGWRQHARIVPHVLRERPVSEDIIISLQL